ncbi:unnamed protein product [Sympodiomycopsis kandeliae]
MSASEPYSIACVLDGSHTAKDRISSLAVHGEKLYVGRPSGSLSIYRLPQAASSVQSPNSSSISTSNVVSPSSSSSSSTPSGKNAAGAILLSTHLNFHPPNRAVLSLRIVPSLSLILSLCSDGVLHMNHLATLESVQPPPPVAAQAAKGILAFEAQTSIVEWPKDDLQELANVSASPNDGHKTFRGTRSRQIDTDDSGRTLPRGKDLPASSSSRRSRPMTMFSRHDKDKTTQTQPNLRLVTILIVSIRRKLLVLRWLDGEPWDYQDLTLPHSPRSLTFAPSNATTSSEQAQARTASTPVFLAYGTPNDFGVLEIPPASESSGFHHQTLAQRVGEKREFLRDEKQWGKVKELNIPAYTAEYSQHGEAPGLSRTGSPARDGFRSTKPTPIATSSQGTSEAPRSAGLPAAASTAGLLSGLGGYIGFGARSKLPFVRTVPRPSPSKDSKSGEASLSQQSSAGEVLLIRDNTAVFLSASSGNPARRRGLEWPAAVDDVALLPSQHIFSALPSTAQSSAALQIRSTKTLDVMQTIELPPSSNGHISQCTISALLAPPSQSSSAASNTLYAVLTPNSTQDSAQIYKFTPRPWKARLTEMIRQRMWEGAIELVRDGITDGEIEADDSMGFTVGADVKSRLLKPLLALSSLDRFLAGCAAHARKQNAAANAAFEDAVDTWIDLDLNPAKVLCIFPERLAGHGLSRPQSQWAKIWGEELIKEGFHLDDVVDLEVAEPQEVLQDKRVSRLGSRRGSTTSVANSVTNVTGTASAIRDRSRLTSLFGRASRPASIVGEPSSSPTPRKDGFPAQKPETPSANSPAPSHPHPQATKGYLPKNETAEANKQQSVRHSAMEAESRELDEDAGTSAPPSLKNVDMSTNADAAFELSKSCLEALGRFLADRRRIFKPILETSPKVENVRPASSMISFPSMPLPKMSIEDLTTLARVVDTALFKTFLETKPSLVGPLCRIENWCEVTEVEELLESRGKHNELVSLYGGKSMHGKALELLRKLSQNEEDEDEKVGPTIRYLQNLGPDHIAVILENAKWVLQHDRHRGMEIFTADTGKVSMLPRLEVVNLLSSFDPDLCAQYLEHIIHVIGEASPEVHERLGLIYLERVLSSPSSPSLKQDYHHQLFDFLYESQQYRPERILGKVPPDSLWDIRAVLLGRMGQHNGALSIYVDKIGGEEGEQRAEEYCIDVYENSPDDAEGKNIFLLLLRLYLQHTANEQGEDGQKNSSKGPMHDLNPALRLISNHATRLDLTAVLDLLPPLIPIASIQRFLRKGLQASLRNHFDHRVVAAISKERNLQVDEHLGALRNRRVKITQGRTCTICGKRLGVSVLAVTNRGEALHYGCRQETSI